MPRLSRFLLTIIIVCAGLVIVRPAAAEDQPSSQSIIGATCNSVTVSGFLAGGNENAAFVVLGADNNTPIGPTINVTVSGPYTITLSFTANQGSTAFVTNDTFGEPIDFIVPSCGSYQGPGIPAGFVLQTITCNTPVFTTAGGKTPSSTDAITAGQTWFVNPKPIIDTKGNSWTEIFVSSYVDPFIPTSCLGGAPAH